MINIKKATLYTSAILNGSWLLVSIDTALWLHKSDGYKEITICCAANYNPLNFFTLLLRVKNLSTYLTKNKFKKLRSFLNSSNSKKDKLSELLNILMIKKYGRSKIIFANFNSSNS